MNAIRFFSSAAENGSKNFLATLRKKTGFTLINCRKALQCNDNDLAKAEIWLKNEAKRLGWEKAQTLQNRIASEGLIAITKTKNKVAMAEINCETDFVARNKNFVALAEMVARICISHPIPDSDVNVKKVLLSKDLANLVTPDKENLIDFTAKRIGEFGENIVLKRAMIYEADGDTELDVAVHPPNLYEKEILTGKYGAFVAYKKIPGSSVQKTETCKNFGKNLCTHIIGMNPDKIGNIDKVTPENMHDKNTHDESSNYVNEDIEQENHSSELVHQDFILDCTMTVGDVLIKNGKEVINFHRFECGEDVEIKSELSEKEMPDSEQSEKLINAKEN